MLAELILQGFVFALVAFLHDGIEGSLPIRRNRVNMMLRGVLALASDKRSSGKFAPVAQVFPARLAVGVVWKCFRDFRDVHLHYNGLDIEGIRMYVLLAGEIIPQQNPAHYA